MGEPFVCCCQQLLGSWHRRVTGSHLQTPSMSSHHRRGKTILPIHFRAIIFKKTYVDRLKIPTKFTRRYGGGLSNPVFVKPPGGTQWKVYWTRQNGEVWFEKGWKEFTENYSLDHGHSVVFTYEGTSQFDAHIYDKSALEIDYNLCNTCDEKVNLDESDGESVEILKEIPPKQKARQKVPSFSTQPRKRMRGEKVADRTSSLNWPKEPRAQESVPSLKGYIENEEKNVMLQIGKRTWYVKLSHCDRPTARRLSAGWSLFACESELQPEDVCIFELVNRKDSVFKVHVFRRDT